MSIQSDQFALKNQKHLLNIQVQQLCSCNCNSLQAQHWKKQNMRIAATLYIYHILKCAVKRSYSLIYQTNCSYLPISKIAILTLFRIVRKNMMSKTFTLLKSQIQGSNKNKQIQNVYAIQDNQLNDLQCQFTKMEQIKYINSIKLKLDQLQKNSKKDQNKHKYINIELQNKWLREQNKKLQQQIQLANKRQERQNQKKKESLQMLAQQLQEKNELIQDLKKNLRAYIDQSKTGGNVLEDQFITLKKQIQSLERTKFKLQTQLAKLKLQMGYKLLEISKFRETMKTIGERQKKCQLLTTQYEVEIKKLTKARIHYEQLSRLYNLKRKSLTNQIHQSNTNQNLKVYMCKQQYQFRLNLILQFIRNISNKEKIHEDEIKNIFDIKETQIILKYKNMFDLNPNQNRADRQIKNEKQEYYEQLSGIFTKEANNQCQTILQILNNPMKNQRNEHDSQRLDEKLLVMESQAHKQIQKISQLKSKIMRIREIVFIFLKALQITSDSKPDILKALDLVIQIFQYSEEELQQIVVSKKKKVFGFI